MAGTVDTRERLSRKSFGPRFSSVGFGNAELGKSLAIARAFREYRTPEPRLYLSITALRGQHG
jgi:hypothetical protein